EPAVAGVVDHGGAVARADVPRKSEFALAERVAEDVETLRGKHERVGTRLEVADLVDAVHLLDHELVGALAALQDVAPAVAGEDVVVLAAPERVITGVAVEGVAALVPAHEIVAARAVHEVV